MYIRLGYFVKRIVPIVAILVILHNEGLLPNFTIDESFDLKYLLKRDTSGYSENSKQLQMPSHHKKVLLFCYMRGGSSFFSQLFDQNEDCMYWYEIIAAFYMATYGFKSFGLPQEIFWYQHQQGNVTQRDIPTWEHRLLAEFNHNLMNCKFNKLPIEALTHKGFLYTTMSYLRSCFTKIFGRRIQDCYLELPQCQGNIASAIRSQCARKINLAEMYLKEKNNKEIIEDEFLQFAKCRNLDNYTFNCIPKFEDKCRKSKIVAYKGLRLTMSSVEFMLEKDPDMKILYFVRDPRAIALSRMRASVSFRELPDPVIETKYLCKKMMKDYLVYKELRVHYPEAIKLFRYEDLVQDRHKYVREMYRFIGADIHPSVLTWMEENLRGNKSVGLRKTVVDNPISLIDKWRTKTTLFQQQEMISNCKEILDVLGYK